VSFVVHDASTVAARADPPGLDVVIGLTAELGQRHLMVVDPDGVVVHIIERVPLDRRDVARLADLRRRHREATVACR
jgi:hypothetical protein